MRYEYLNRHADVLRGDVSVLRDNYRNSEKDKVREYLRKNEMISTGTIECLGEIDLERIAQGLHSTKGTENEKMYEDLENVKTLYTALKDLPLYVASDVRFWKGLIHGPFWDYIQQRKVSLYKKDLTQKDLDKALQRDFHCQITTSGKRIFAVNCLSRLWWMGHYTYDRDNTSDQFHLTNVLFKNAASSSFTIIASSSLTSRKDNILGILSAIKKRADAGELIERDKHIRVATMYLNDNGTTLLLDFMAKKEIEEVVSKRFDDLYGMPKPSHSSESTDENGSTNEDEGE